MVLNLHRGRQLLIKQRTMIANHFCAACTEFGVVRSKGPSGFESLRERLRDDESDLPATLQESQSAMLDVHDRLNESI